MHFFKSEKELARAKSGLYHRVQRQFVEIYHDELESRYDVDFLARHEEIRELDLFLLPQEKTDWIKKFFKLYLYPKDENRHSRDQAFLSLIELLYEPKKLITLIPSMPRIIWHIGSRFPQALSVGLQSNQAFHLSLVLERGIVDRVIEHYGWTEKDQDSAHLTLADVKWAYAQNDYKQAHKLYELGISIFASIKDFELLQITQEILDLVQKQMHKNENKFSRHIVAIDYGKDILNQTMALFRNFSNEEIEILIKIVEVIEKKYMDATFAGKPFDYKKLINVSDF